MSDCNDVDNIAGNSAKSNNDQLTYTAGCVANQNGETKSANGIVRRRSVPSLIPRFAIESYPTNESLQISSNHTFDLHNLSSSDQNLSFTDICPNDIFETCSHNGLTNARYFSEPPTVSSSKHDAEVFRAHSSPEVNYGIQPQSVSSSNESVEMIRGHNSMNPQDIYKPCDVSNRHSSSNVELMPSLTAGHVLSKKHYLYSSNNKDELVQLDSFTDAHITSQPCPNLSVSNAEGELVKGNIMTDSNDISNLDIASFSNNQFELVQEGSFTDDHNISVAGSNLSSGNSEVELVEGYNITDSDSDDDEDDGDNPHVQPCAYSRKYEEKWVGPESVIDTSHLCELGNVFFVNDQFELIQEDSLEDAHIISELGNMLLRINNHGELIQDGSFTDSIRSSESDTRPNTSICNIEVELVKRDILKHVHGIHDLENALSSCSQVQFVQEETTTMESNISQAASTSFGGNHAQLIQADCFTYAYNTELGSASVHSNTIVSTREDSFTHTYKTVQGSTASSNIVLVHTKSSRVTKGIFQSRSASSRHSYVEFVNAHGPSSSKNREESVGHQRNTSPTAREVSEPSSSTRRDEAVLETLRLAGGSTEPHCRFCQLGGQHESLIAPCHCRGVLTYIHYSCLTRYLNQAERNTCQLCNFRFNTVETRRYSLRQALRIWTRHPRNRPHWGTIMATTSLLTVCMAGLVAMVLLVLQASGPMTAFIVLMLVSTYVLVMTMLLRDQFRPWYIWWNRCVHISVIISPETWESRTPGPPNAKYQGSPTLQSSSSSDS